MGRKVVWMIFISVMICNHSACKSSQPAVLPPPAVAAPVIPETEDPVKEKPFAAPDKQLYRNSISIGIVMPFYLNENFPNGVELDSAEIDTRSLFALNFYEGALIAVDSIKKSGIHIQLKVADNSADTSAYQWMLMNYQWLKQNDLNFIHFANNQCDDIAKSAEKFRIPVIISQCSNLSAELNDFTAVISPSSRTQCIEASKYIATEFPIYDIAVMARQTGRENELAEIFMSAMNELVPGKATRIAPSDTASWKKKLTASDKETVLILASSDEYFVTAVLNTVDLAGKKITVIGMPTWENFETIRLGSFANLDVIYFSSSWLEMTDEDVKLFRDQFIKQYKTDITWAAWQGYQMVMSASNTAYKEKVIEMFADYYSKIPGGGYENQSVSIIRYSGFETLRLKKTKP